MYVFCYVWFRYVLIALLSYVMCVWFVLAFFSYIFMYVVIDWCLYFFIGCMYVLVRSSCMCLYGFLRYVYVLSYSCFYLFRYVVSSVCM